MSDLTAFLLARITEDEQQAGNSRSMPLCEVDCPCGKRGHISHAGDGYEITHAVGWAPPDIDGSGWVHSGGHTVTETHIFRGAEAGALFRSFPVSKQSRRVLAECEAKRRIVAEHEGYEVSPLDADEAPWWRCSSCEYPTEYPCPTLRALALPYADHADYRDEWRP